MAFTRTTWVAQVTQVSAAELNRIEQGVVDAHAIPHFATANPVPVANGGTGSTTAANARTALGLGAASLLADPVPVANGGTGSTSAANARTALGTDAAGSSRPPSGSAGGSLSGSYPNPGIAASAIGVANMWEGFTNAITIDSTWRNLFAIANTGMWQFTIVNATGGGTYFTGAAYYDSTVGLGTPGSGNNLVFQYSGGYVQAKSSNNVGYTCYITAYRQR